LYRVSFLDDSELKNINGGNEATKAVFDAVGATVGYFGRLWKIRTADSNNSRFR